MFDFYPLFKKAAFLFDPEMAHEKSLMLLAEFPQASAAFFSGPEPLYDYSLNCAGLSWPFPMGLAAGLDKNAVALDFFSQLPFGAIEVGTVTPLPQAGNAKPRMFRLVAEESLRNKMGFNNLGALKIYQNILKCKRNGKLLGVNLGKNKDTPQNKAWQDYQILFKQFAPCADYLVINVSSPNTPGLRDLQNKESLREILEALKKLRAVNNTPLFIKISPDLSHEDLPGIIECADEFKLNGLIATNTTIMQERGAGGVSGKLLSHKGSLMRGKILELLRPFKGLDLIGVGGMSSFDDLWEFWQMGGKVAQLFTSFIYQGPQVLWGIQESINSAISMNKCRDLKELIKNIAEARRPH